MCIDTFHFFASSDFGIPDGFDNFGSGCDSNWFYYSVYGTELARVSRSQSASGSAGVADSDTDTAEGNASSSNFHTCTADSDVGTANGNTSPSDYYTAAAYCDSDSTLCDVSAGQAAVYGAIGCNAL